MRSTVWVRTRFVSWSVERRVPRRVRPSTVMTRTFSVMLLASVLVAFRFLFRGGARYYKKREEWRLTINVCA